VRTTTELHRTVIIVVAAILAMPACGGNDPTDPRPAIDARLENIPSLAATRDGSAVYFTQSSGLWVFRPADGTVRLIAGGGDTTIAQGVDPLDLRAGAGPIAIGSNGDIVFSDSRHVWRLRDGRVTSLAHASTGDGGGHALAERAVSELAVAADGAVWIGAGTPGLSEGFGIFGLYRVDPLGVLTEIDLSALGWFTDMAVQVDGSLLTSEVGDTIRTVASDGVITVVGGTGDLSLGGLGPNDYPILLEDADLEHAVTNELITFGDAVLYWDLRGGLVELTHGSIAGVVVPITGFDGLQASPSTDLGQLLGLAAAGSGATFADTTGHSLWVAFPAVGGRDSASISAVDLASGQATVVAGSVGE